MSGRNGRTPFGELLRAWLSVQQHYESIHSSEEQAEDCLLLRPNRDDFLRAIARGITDYQA